MAIGEIDDHASVHLLETVSQSVNLGKDTFTTGSIRKSTIEECVHALRSCRRLLEEYGISQPEQMRVVATSAVREAANRLAFLDRIYIATGLQVEPIEEAEVNRMTFLGIQPHLNSEPGLADARTIVTEVGGGSTDLLFLQSGQVAYSHTYRLGSVRLRETLRSYRAPVADHRSIMKSQIRRTLEQAGQHVPRDGSTEMIALGGDIRFAASQLLPNWNGDVLARISLPELEQFTNEVLARSEDELVRTHHITFPDAETLGPALLVYLELARIFQLKDLRVTSLNLRDSLLHDMASRDRWSDEYRNQIIRSALDLGAKFRFDRAHAKHVANLSAILFRSLQSEHQLDSRCQFILHVAALLHEIGLFISSRSHHKHSMYLILNSELFGLTQHDVLLVALVARYHRRASPKPTHQGYSTLDRDDRIVVAKLAAILRIAEALDDSRSQRIHEIECELKNDKLVIAIPHVEDLSLEQLAIKQNCSLFEEIFGQHVLLRKLRS